jgi:Amt family ammonium transporter
LTAYNPESGTSALFICISTGMVLLMQAGFALIENGSVRRKNSSNILIKNMFDFCVGAIMFWLFGYGFAFGSNPSKFIGGDKVTFASAGFEYAKDKDHYASWIFQFSFAASCSTIVSGSLAERAKVHTYILFSALMTTFIYPVVVAWT